VLDYFVVQTRKQELIEERIAYIERTQARNRLKESEKRLSQNIYERGVDDVGFARIRSQGDQALFGGYTTKEMKTKLEKCWENEALSQKNFHQLRI
jgi:DNA-damage-inducible protein D